MSVDDAPASSPEHKHMSVRQHLVLDTSIVIGVAFLYVASLFGYKLFASPSQLPKPDLGTTDHSVVILRLEELNTKNNQLNVTVLLHPDDSIVDKHLGQLTADTAVRFIPQADLGELQYSAGKAPPQQDAKIDVHGNPLNWPFDTYTTDPIEADVLVGAGDSRQYKPAQVEVTGVLEGWDISVIRVGDDSQTPGRPDNVVITISRANAPLVFDLGICLVLITLPSLALFVAIQMVTRRRPFLPPFGTWYAAMLFAVVPLRNFLPGSPPLGAWIDRAIVVWVLIFLAAAMVIYILAWYRDQPPKT